MSHFVDVIVLTPDERRALLELAIDKQHELFHQVLPAEKHEARMTLVTQLGFAITKLSMPDMAVHSAEVIQFPTAGSSRK